jgi:hypothetical protein
MGERPAARYVTGAASGLDHTYPPRRHHAAQPSNAFMKDQE